jgi:hypothetical protein
MDNGNDFFVFSKFYSDEEQDKMEKYCSAAFDKLQTLYPGKKIMQQGHTTLCIESDSLYAEKGIDTYEIGLINGEIPAMCRTRDSEVITFRV